MEPQPLLEVFDEAERCSEERVLSIGSDLLVWSLRRSTWLPTLADAFGAGPGVVLITGRAQPEGNASEEVTDCRRAFTDGGGPRLPVQGDGSWRSSARPAEDSTGAGAAQWKSFEYGLIEERLQPISIQEARRLLTELIRAGVRLSRPVVIAAGGEGTTSRRHATVYMGLRMPPDSVGENTPPGGGGAAASGMAVAETISVVRPFFGDREEVTVADVLSGCRGAASRGEVQLHVRYDHHLDPGLCERGGRGGGGSGEPHPPPCAAAAAAAPGARVELLPGPFLSLELAWSSDYARAASEPFARPPGSVAAGDHAVVHVRGTGGGAAARAAAGGPGRGLLRRDLLDLTVLERLSALAQAQPSPPGEEALQPLGRHGVLHDEFAAQQAVVRLLKQEEQRAAASAQSVGGGGAPPRPRKRQHGDAGAYDDDEEDGRPSRDFVDRLWLEVFSRCATTKAVAGGMGALLEALSRSEGVAPIVRRTNATEAAELVRLAVKISTLRRYSAPSEACKLKALLDQWLEQRQRFSATRHIVSLAVGAGMECLGRDFLHMITNSGSVTAQDLAPFVAAEGQPPPAGAPRLDAPGGDGLHRLHCLRHIAELSAIAARHRLCADSSRRLVLKAVEFYQRPAAKEGLAAPVFSVPLSKAASGAVLASLPAEASSFSVRCGGAFVRAERLPRGRAPLDADDDMDTEEIEAASTARGEGLWRPPGCGLLQYRVTVVDRCTFAGVGA